MTSAELIRSLLVGFTGVMQSDGELLFQFGGAYLLGRGCVILPFDDALHVVDLLVLRLVRGQVDFRQLQSTVRNASLAVLRRSQIRPFVVEHLAHQVLAVFVHGE